MQLCSPHWSGVLHLRENHAGGFNKRPLFWEGFHTKESL